MHRREFFQSAGAALAISRATHAAASPRKASPQNPMKVKPKVGTQHSVDDDVLTVISSFGVKNVLAMRIGNKMDEKWSVDGLKQFRERIEKHGVSLDLVQVPLPSAFIANHPMKEIMLAKSPERDRQIDDVCQMIRNCKQAGIPGVTYNMSILGVVRSGRTPGRGGASYSTFKFNELPDKDQLTEAGKVNADAYWERISYFLDRVVPVANEEKIKMGCHPHDPGMPVPEGYRGIDTVLGTVDGLKKFIAIKESPYHGLNFCQGTVSEMLQDPGREIHDVIRYFGSRKKIFNVHFRNIKGKRLDFQETFPDDGSVNMLQAIKTYYEVGYDGMLMPDHVPQIPGDKAGLQAFAFCFGYIQAAIQTLG